LTLSVPAHVYIREEKLCTGYRATYIYVLNKNPSFMVQGTKTLCKFCVSCFFGNQAIIRVFRAHDRFSSLSGAKIMAHKLKFGYKFKSHKR